MKNIAVVATNKLFRSNLNNELERLSKFGWKVYILTDKPDEYKDLQAEQYNYTIFSYVDKILFPIRISENIKQGILYVDVDRIHELSDEFLTSGCESNSFLYTSKWPTCEYITFVKSNYFDILIEYFESINYDYTKLPCLLEQIFYVPYSPDLHRVRLDIEHVKPILEYISIINKLPSPGIGTGEGVALAFGILANNFKLNTFENAPQKQYKTNRFI